MAIVAIFDVVGMTAEQYDDIDARLAVAGEREPDGRAYHVAAPTEDGWLVVDIWDSQEQLERFSNVLMPILHAVGAPTPEPRIMPVHNVIKG